MAKKIVHVYQARIRGNIKKTAAEREPPLIIRSGKARAYANEIEITGPCRIVYRPDQPLSCGARLWIETDSHIEVLT